MAAVLVGIAGVVRLRTSVSVVILTLRTLEAKLKLPLRNAQVMFDLADDDKNVIFHTENNNRNRNNRKSSIKLESGGDHRYLQVENSRNGLLRLIDGTTYDKIVCNPSPR